MIFNSCTILMKVKLNIIEVLVNNVGFLYLYAPESAWWVLLSNGLDKNMNMYNL